MREVSDPVSRVERAAHQITASPHVFCPEHDKKREAKIGARLEAVQLASFDQFVAELAESKSSLIVAKTRSGNPAELDIGETRCIAVATLKAETDRLADRQRSQVRIRKQGWRQDPNQDSDGREGCRVFHRRQIDEFPDCPARKP